VVALPVIGGLIRGLTCGAFALSFALMHSSTMLRRNKNQGKPAGGRTGSDRSAGFSRPTRGKSRRIDIISSGRLAFLS